MRERWITLLLAAGALALFYALIFPKPQHRSAPEGLPLSTDSRPDGYLAIWHWLAEEHIPRLSLRRHYLRLSDLPRRSGNVLIVTLPQQMPADALEIADLMGWVARGNTLLLLAALDDEPVWSLATDHAAMGRFLAAATGLKFLPAPPATLLRALAAKPWEIVPRGTQPLLAGVAHVAIVPGLPSRSWRAHLTHSRLPLELAERDDDRRAALWLEHRGSGQVILSAAASPFSNGGMALPDNARLLSNIIAWSRAPGGTVVFDDAHGGLTAFYDARAFFADPRLHATLAWVVALWLAFVLGSQPLRARRSAWEPLEETAYIEGSARYLAAVVPPAELARRLIEDFLAERPRSERQADPWTWLRTRPGISDGDYRTLEALYERARAGGRIDLIRLQNLLARLRRQLS